MDYQFDDTNSIVFFFFISFSLSRSAFYCYFSAFIRSVHNKKEDTHLVHLFYKYFNYSLVGFLFFLQELKKWTIRNILLWLWFSTFLTINQNSFNSLMMHARPLYSKIIWKIQRNATMMARSDLKLSKQTDEFIRQAIFIEFAVCFIVVVVVACLLKSWW